MNSVDFTDVLTQQLDRCKSVLSSKANEYATLDRLHNFKIASKLQSCSPISALAGMMAKHTVSVYDMCRSDEIFPMELWDEKITDSINYLILLRALVQDVYESENEQIFIENYKDEVNSND